ncbi:Universal stress protein [Paramixta manurensis]|uniref:Universal stress protein n=1 Tax=Paramixta manurensis TaxID=2740817 RepID=A0A6M8UL83_9GAMM|nr:Universal stress protein [Erwiniaceae bacterium PD-1]
MNSYTHALVLVHGKEDGSLLLAGAVALAQPLNMKITLAHISDDYREMNYVSDSLMDDAVSEEVVKAKALLSELSASTDQAVDTRQLVTMRRFEDVEKCIAELGIDLVIAGHRNRLMSALTSRSAEYINHLTVDVLIKHIHD